MSLGNRTARTHDTRGMQKHGMDATLFWEHHPGDRVMTVDKIAGIVTAVEDGPVPGNESYIVKLDNGAGGGQYTAGQLSEMPGTTASVDHTAADDYPELGDILTRRPDIAKG
jgi:hypothetical protein